MALTAFHRWLPITPGNDAIASLSPSAGSECQGRLWFTLSEIFHHQTQDGIPWVSMFKDALDFRFQSLKLIMLILFKMVLRVRVTAKRKMENVVSSQETPCLIFLLAFTPTLHFEQIQHNQFLNLDMTWHVWPQDWTDRCFLFFEDPWITGFLSEYVAVWPTRRDAQILNPVLHLHLHFLCQFCQQKKTCGGVKYAVCTSLSLPRAITFLPSCVKPNLNCVLLV